MKLRVLHITRTDAVENIIGHGFLGKETYFTTDIWDILDYANWCIPKRQLESHTLLVLDIEFNYDHAYSDPHEQMRHAFYLIYGLAPKQINVIEQIKIEWCSKIGVVMNRNLLKKIEDYNLVSYFAQESPKVWKPAGKVNFSTDTIAP